MFRIFLTMLLFFTSATICMSQITKQQAITFVMDSIVADQVDSVNVLMEVDLQTGSYYILRPWDSIAAPYFSYWIFFIDLQPKYAWGHACEYIFINSSSGEYSIISNHLPPFRPDNSLEQVSMSYIAPVCPIDPSIQHNRPYPTENHHLYAIMFSGGDYAIGGPPGNAAFYYAFSHM